MRFQDYAADAAQTAADEAFRYAAAVPADKLDWSPNEGGRSVLDICRELAMTPTWAKDTLEGKEHDFSEESIARMKAEQAAWTTVEQCQSECNRRLGELKELYKSITDERLSDTRWLPYDGGRDFTFMEMMEYPRWNFTYHLGQISYIQMLYGDKEMH